jgi:hypothetical protein
MLLKADAGHQVLYYEIFETKGKKIDEDHRKEKMRETERSRGIKREK